MSARMIELAVLKLRHGSYSLRSWSTAAASSDRWPRCHTCSVCRPAGNKLVASLGATGLLKPQVRAMTAELDKLVDGFRSSRLDAGPYTFYESVPYPKVRKGDRAVSVYCLIAIGMNADGHRRSSVWT